MKFMDPEENAVIGFKIFKITFIVWGNGKLHSSGDKNQFCLRVQASTQEEAANKLRKQRAQNRMGPIEITGITDEGNVDIV